MYFTIFFQNKKYISILVMHGFIIKGLQNVEYYISFILLLLSAVIKHNTLHFKGLHL